MDEFLYRKAFSDVIFIGGMEEVKLTRTISCPLRTSGKKNRVLRESCEIFGDVMEYASDVLPSFDEDEWRPNCNTLYRVCVMDTEFSEREVAGINNLKAGVCREAAQKVAEAFQSWLENGKVGNRPRYEGSDYIRLPSESYEVVENSSGYGFKGSFISYHSEWWSMSMGSHQMEYIEEVLEGDAEFGSAELFYNDGSPFVNLTVTWSVDVLEPDECDYMAGVDLGENVLYAVSVLDSDGIVEGVEMETGEEFRHHRDRIDRKRARLQESGNLDSVRLSRERERYTEYVTDKVSRDIINFVRDFDNIGLVLEDLTGYRSSADNPIHDWPYEKIQRKIAYKAREESIPVQAVDPSYTSAKCRKCGCKGNRESVEFECESCGYEVHADVNGSMNIASRGFENI